MGCNDNRIRGTPCDHGTPLTVTEEYTQMSLWCIFASNLMLGSDLRNISNTTLDIIGVEKEAAVFFLCVPFFFRKPRMCLDRLGTDVTKAEAKSGVSHREQRGAGC
eukprot:COSAG06_NODE_2721_length_6387_cov_3.702449_7_plen_106_part_00